VRPGGLDDGAEHTEAEAPDEEVEEDAEASDCSGEVVGVNDEVKDDGGDDDEGETPAAAGEPDEKGQDEVEDPVHLEGPEDSGANAGDIVDAVDGGAAGKSEGEPGEIAEDEFPERLDEVEAVAPESEEEDESDGDAVEGPGAEEAAAEVARAGELGAVDDAFPEQVAGHEEEEADGGDSGLAMEVDGGEEVASVREGVERGAMNDEDVDGHEAAEAFHVGLEAELDAGRGGEFERGFGARREEADDEGGNSVEDEEDADVFEQRDEPGGEAGGNHWDSRVRRGAEGMGEGRL
jgi:hypothetical protein